MFVLVNGLKVGFLVNRMDVSIGFLTSPTSPVNNCAVVGFYQIFLLFLSVVVFVPTAT